MENLFQNLISWLTSRGIKILFILIGAYLVNRFLQIFIEKIIQRGLADRMSEERKKRVETLVSIFSGTLRFVIYIIALLMILPEFGINIAPILAGLGLAGLAVGMAAKDIISDFISGIFIILENQYQIGDKVKIVGIEGKVKEISLRRTVIVDENNFSHSIPNSQIKLVSKKAE
ncbi:MAG: mechanosensitive ion channel [Patescibacteria group bacterium]|nr:mechanosensitive ion channel [Patescibacteria group bacterium]